MNSSIRWLFPFFAILIAWLIADLLTKHVVFNHLRQSGLVTLPIIRNYVHFSLVENRGFIWGFAQNYGSIILLFNILVIPLIFGLYLSSIYTPGFFVSCCSWLLTIGMALILAGALGNVSDRLRFGYVRDFMDVTIPIIYFRWPVFNLADAGITAGTFCIAYALHRDAPEQEEYLSEDDEEQ